MAATLYDDAFFSSHDQGCRASARQAIPIVLEFTRPASIVDVGCGTGTWLAGFRAAGIADVVGVDGDYVDRDKLSIDRERFFARDLEQPLDLGRRFDMAMSLEVAEHLPDRAADTFIASLVRLAPLILFSAAIPQQGGTNHCNEQ
jgi:2-polyprenyl-3-methyl-5-hydroxy-6-metoxy-1,4-benzoquinol methylase